MTTFLSRISNQVQLAYVPHTSVQGDVWQLQRKSTATSSGASNGTTLIDDQLGATDNVWNGKYWIHILSGDAKGEWRRIVDYTGSSTTAKLEGNGFTAQIASGVEYELWLSPEPVVVATATSAGGNQCVDTNRNEPDDFWVGYMLVAANGGTANSAVRSGFKITSFVSSTGVFTVDTSDLPIGWGSTSAAGDVYLLRKAIDATDISAGVAEEYIPRGTNRVNFSKGDGVVGPRSGTFSFSLPIRPSGSLASSGNKPQQSNVGGLLEACGLEETITQSQTATTGGTTTSIVFTGTTDVPKIGQMVIHNGNATFVTAISSSGGNTTLTVSPALPVAPASGDVINLSRMYSTTTDGDLYGVTLEYEVDSVRHTITGCMGNVTLNDGAAPTMSFEFQVDHWIRNIQASGCSYVRGYSTVAPILAQDRLAYLDGTAADIGGLTATPGTEVVAKGVQGSQGVNGRVGFQISNIVPGATFNTLLDAQGSSIPEDGKFLKRTANDFAVVFGSHGSTFAVRLPVARLIESPTPTDLDGVVGAPNVVEAQDAGRKLNETNNVSKVPDFAFHIS